jgi:hypothetical protein
MGAFDADGCGTGTCQLLWTSDVLGDAPIAVSDGRLLASTWAEGLVAFAPTSPSPSP